MKNKINQRGYTLLELLTVMGVLSVVGIIVVSVVTISLQGAKKSDLNELARQNGDIALSQMVKNIRYAKTLNSPVSCFPALTVPSITVTSLNDNAQTTYACSGSNIASNGASMINASALSVSSCSFTCSQQSRSDPPTIQIQFSLNAKGATSLVESTATVPFQSSVTMRNYAP